MNLPVNTATISNCCFLLYTSNPTYLASSASLRKKAFVGNFAKCSPNFKNSFTGKLYDKFVVKQQITP